MFYKIESAKNEPNLFKADGYVKCSLHEDKIAPSKKFHTEYPTEVGAKNQIKKLLEDYIDFEWHEFHEMRD